MLSLLCSVILVANTARTSNSIPNAELWINTTYHAENLGIRPETLPQCKAWNLWWQLQRGDIAPTDKILAMIASRKKQLSFNNVAHLLKFDLPKHLLSNYKIVHVNFEELCKNHSHYLFIESFAAAKQYDLNLTKICNNYDERKKILAKNPENYVEFDENTSTTKAIHRRDFPSQGSEINKWKSSLSTINNLNSKEQDGNMSVSMNSGFRIINPRVKFTYQMKSTTKKETSTIFLHNEQIADFFELGKTAALFQRYKEIRIDVEKACSSEQLDANYHRSSMTSESEDLNGKIMDDQEITIAEEQKFNTLVTILNQGIRLDIILNLFDSGILSNLTPLPSSVLLPILNDSHYDFRLSPADIDGHTAEVLFGILVDSISNFEQSTMDYDMNLWLRMAWRDLRLSHKNDRPILINDEQILQKIWRPAPFFQNAKEAEYYRMTRLNFWTYVFPGGEVFFETRLYLKPTCKLILCKYPHDSQMCSLKISAIASSEDSVRYDWFPNLRDAIRMNKNTEVEEIYVANYYKQRCNGLRKTGNFSCLEARYLLKRSLGYHMARTYFPTAICVVFSWISVWLPEEFVTGRIFGSLTLFFTLSAESSAAKEVLPKVSYMKAIDLWFGFTSSFVFVTMLEALVVISLENKSRQLRKKAEAGLDGMSQYQMMLLMMKSTRYHSAARRIDKYCRTLYPVIFLLFLIIYYFVITDGDETKCLQKSHDEL